MSTDYKQWCEKRKDIAPLIRALKSSKPEQYIGFYLSRAFGSELEYQKQFDWLGRRSLDIYVPSLQLAIEYDGIYYHPNKSSADKEKTLLCHSHGIYLIRIQEKTEGQRQSKKQHEIAYYFERDYINIDIAIRDVCQLINQIYNTSIQIDVDLNRDKEEIISYIQGKYYEKSIAYVWPESEDYWLEEENGLTNFDVFYTDNRRFKLRCPYCQKGFILYTRYCHHRKSLAPCECEMKGIENALKKAIENYRETGEIVIFDDSLCSRRLYDRMASAVWYSMYQSKEEQEMYKRLGFTLKFPDKYSL